MGGRVGTKADDLASLPAGKFGMLGDLRAVIFTVRTKVQPLKQEAPELGWGFLSTCYGRTCTKRVGERLLALTGAKAVAV